MIAAPRNRSSGFVTMNDDLNTARGIIYGILLSLPFWLLLLLVLAVWVLVSG